MCKLKIIVLLLLILLLVGCEEDNTSVKYNKIYRVNSDGSSTCWSVFGGYKVVNSLVCWNDEHGEDFCISGDITITTIRVEPKVLPDNNNPAKTEENK